MPNPTAQYRVRYNSEYLPGYVQAEEIPLTMRNVAEDIMNRDGGPIYFNGAGLRTLSLDFRVLSRLNNVPGIVHLGDCLDQYREALRIVSRVESGSTLYLGDVDHYLIGNFRSATNPLTAPDHRAINYRMVFDTTPYFLGQPLQTSEVISGDDTISINIGDTRKTYPRFSIPIGITDITISDPISGKSFTMTGTHGTNWVVDCGNLTVTRSNGDNSINQLMSSPDFGMYHVGSGTFTANITGVVGTGTLFMYLTPRIER